MDSYDNSLPQQMDVVKQPVYDILDIPDSISHDRSLYYSNSSKQILLEGPRGLLIAKYFSGEIPDPKYHKFYCLFPRDYIPYAGSKIPNTNTATVSAICWPIETLSDTRRGLSSSAPPDINSDLIQTTNDIPLYPSDPNGRQTPRDLKGSRVSPNGMITNYGDTSHVIDENGVRIRGRVTNTHAESRGVTQQSPLFGVLPKTAVTFFASDYLPDTKTLNNVVSIIAAIGLVFDTLVRLAAIIETTLIRSEINDRNQDSN